VSEEINPENGNMEIKEAARKYIYEDYARWNDGKRYELINGKVYMMSPAPSEAHQDIVVELGFQLKSFLKGKPCKVFVAPFDVCLNGKGDNDNTIVQPDVLVVCDKTKLDGKRCNGVPDLIIEVLSPSNTRHDMLIKFNKYLEAGVREYWIVDPEDKIISVHVLKGNAYVKNVYGIYDEDAIKKFGVKNTAENMTVPVNVLEGCRIDVAEVFGV